MLYDTLMDIMPELEEVMNEIEREQDLLYAQENVVDKEEVESLEELIEMFDSLHDSVLDEMDFY